MRWIIRLLLNALGLLIVAKIVPGFQLSGVLTAMVAAAVFGLVNATIGIFLKVVTFPLTVLTLGLFWWILNAILLLMVAAVVPGFHIRGFGPALLGAIVLALVNLILRWIVGEAEGRRV